MTAVAPCQSTDHSIEIAGHSASLTDCHALGRVFVGAGKSPIQALHLAQKLLSRAGSLTAVIQSAPARLRSIGADEHEIEAIKAVEGAIDATLVRRLEDRPVLSSSQAVVDYLHARISFRHREQFECIFLDGALKFLHIETISIGSFNTVDVNIRDIVKIALELNASRIIVSHNHPSGNLEPTRSDIQSTKALTRVCENLHIQVLDHLIVSRSGFFSMRSAGLFDS